MMRIEDINEKLEEIQKVRQIIKDRTPAGEEPTGTDLGYYRHLGSLEKEYQKEKIKALLRGGKNDGHTLRINPRARNIRL